MAMTDRELIKEVWDEHKALKRRVDFLEQTVKKMTELFEKHSRIVEKQNDAIEHLRTIVTRLSLGQGALLSDDFISEVLRQAGKKK